MLILSKEQIQGADNYSKNELGLFEELLMENAGQAFLTALKKVLNYNDKISVFCGRGNNGGDGIVLARRLKQIGFSVRLIFVDGIEKFSKAAGYHFNVYCRCGFDYELLNLNDESAFDGANFIVDAIFGTGFHGKPDEQKSKIFDRINESKAAVVALDIPSGISVDEAFFEKAVKANFTLSVSYLKRSAFLYPAKLNYGKVFVVDAGIVCKPDEAQNYMKTWGAADFKRTFAFKESFASKWSSGSALIVGGSSNMIGAVVLAAKACIKSGVGLLRLAVPESLKSIVAASVFEATYANVEEENGVLTDLEFDGNFNVVAVGPGLSRNELVKNVVEKIISAQVPIVLDADALSFLNDEMLIRLKNRKFATILTPHEKEMARLCGCNLNFVKMNRFELSKQKAAEWNTIVVLKGPHTVITAPNGLQFVNLSGNEGLAKGGTGDVLTGIISAMVARANLNDGPKVVEAVNNAVFVHGFCSNLLVQEGADAVSMTATEVVESLSKAFKKLRPGRLKFDKSGEQFS